MIVWTWDGGAEKANSLSPGMRATCQGKYDITQDDLDEGQVRGVSRCGIRHHTVVLHAASLEGGILRLKLKAHAKTELRYRLRVTLAVQ